MRYASDSTARNYNKCVSLSVDLSFFHAATEKRIEVDFCMDIVYGPESDKGFIQVQQRALGR